MYLKIIELKIKNSQTIEFEKKFKTINPILGI